MKRVFFSMLGFCALTVLWVLLVWYVLPVDLLKISEPELVLWHFGPPVSVMAGWFLFRRVLIWRGMWVAAGITKQQEQARREADKAAQEAQQVERQRQGAHLECRAVFLALASVPDWLGGKSAQWRLCVQDAEKLRGTGSEAAISDALQRVFLDAFFRSVAVAWLPIYVLPGREHDHAAQLEWVKRGWQLAAIDSCCFEDDALPSPICRYLPGSASIVERVQALFDDDPTLPALVLLGMGSPVGDAPKVDDFPGNAPLLASKNPGVRPGHAVVAVVLSRPGLVAMPYVDGDKSGQGDPHRPFWERPEPESVDRSVSLVWGKVPPKAQAGFCALKPFAAVYRSDSAVWRGGRETGAALARRVQALIKTVASNAARRAPPLEKAEPGEDPPPGLDLELELDLGWLVYNSGRVEEDIAADRFTSITRELSQLGCELNPAREVGNLVCEHGDVGDACGVLMLAEALIRTGQLQKPVLFTEFGDKGDAVNVGLVQPLNEFPRRG